MDCGRACLSSLYVCKPPAETATRGVKPRGRSWPLQVMVRSSRVPGSPMQLQNVRRLHYNHQIRTEPTQYKPNYAGADLNTVTEQHDDIDDHDNQNTAKRPPRDPGDQLKTTRTKYWQDSTRLPVLHAKTSAQWLTSCKNLLTGSRQPPTRGGNSRNSCEKNTIASNGREASKARDPPPISIIEIIEIIEMGPISIISIIWGPEELK